MRLRNFGGIFTSSCTANSVSTKCNPLPWFSRIFATFWCAVGIGRSSSTSCETRFRCIKNQAWQSAPEFMRGRRCNFYVEPSIGTPKPTWFGSVPHALASVPRKLGFQPLVCTGVCLRSLLYTRGYNRGVRGRSMKYLECSTLDAINSALSRLDAGDCRITGQLEAYSCMILG